MSTDHDHTRGRGTDVARGRVYAAEAQVRALFDSADEHGVRTVRAFGSTMELPVERRFASLESVVDYLHAVQALDWVGSRWPRAAVPVAVRERRGQARAHYSAPPPVIAVPLHEPLRSGGRAWALRELVVLHELAHHLVWDDDSGHGVAFVACHVELVTDIVGPEAGLLLRAALHETGA